MIKESSYKGLKSIIIENNRLRAEFIPEYGSKMVSFFNKERKREFLFQSNDQQLKVPKYNADFSKFDSSGFDEVFPSIDASFYPDGSWAGTPIPDHGEVWALSWKAQIKEEILEFEVYSPRFPYKLSKKVSLQEDGIRIDYKASNFSDEEFKFIWTAHALLNCDHRNTKIILPQGEDKIINVERNSQYLGEWGELHSYPIVKTKSGKKIDMSNVEPKIANNCEKFYIPHRLKNSRCGVEYTDTRERLIYNFPVDKVPYLGVWKTQGGYRGDYNIALEPCTGIYDDLYLADRIGRATIIPARESYKWYLEMKLERY
ncbi:galactose mutarotase-like enzyme [Orenia metallireducens]|uniref:Galactose mutarotase n=1 Tax=Orenia metallireducens TaxID=1413210 RepID=A0A285I913_9FIRM|nr:DUF5107 domain-containing protein [Orenia metallireducens]PRX22458.1 galactose mutarotase-like enzyme [Orenia metallireducens]SNY43546.1 Galactose mutarotase [Orenia metallireducens]